MRNYTIHTLTYIKQNPESKRTLSAHILIPHPATAPQPSKAPIHSPNHGNDAPDPIIRCQIHHTHTPNHDATCPHPQENDPGRVESNPLTIQPLANIPLSYPKTLYI